VIQGRGVRGDRTSLKYVAVEVSEPTVAACPEKNDSSRSVLDRAGRLASMTAEPSQLETR